MSYTSKDVRKQLNPSWTHEPTVRKMLTAFADLLTQREADESAVPFGYIYEAPHEDAWFEYAADRWPRGESGKLVSHTETPLFTHPPAQAAQAIQIGVNRYIVACPTTALAAQPRAPDEDEDKDITGGIDAHLAQPAQSVDVEKDASRYRWLRISACEIAWNEWCSYAPGYTADGPEELDAAIDAALTEKGNG